MSTVLTGGCSKNTASENNTTIMNNTITGPVTHPEAPTIIPGQGPAYAVTGRVYLDDCLVGGAQVEAVSADGTYRTSNMTDYRGAYHLILPDQMEFSVTARFHNLQHKIWPVYLAGASASYTINISSTPKSSITGKGTAIGGPYGYDPSRYNFNRTRIKAVPANAIATLSTVANADGSYYLEVLPNVRYQLQAEASWDAVWFKYRNLHVDPVRNITLDTDETIVIDFEILLP
jgi:hypothetical protein